ncbi:hypothetical protein ACHAPJ_002047 [Fusarium lateritium]
MDSESEVYPNIVCVKYRAAYPTLRPLNLEPVNLTTSDRVVVNQIKDIVPFKIRDILAQYDLHNVYKTRIDFLARQVPNEPRTAVPTLLILTPWKGDGARDAWKQAVHDVVKLIDSLLEDIGARETFHLDVELMAKELTPFKYLGPVLDEHDLHAAWSDIKAVVCGRLESYQATRDSWNTVALFRLGHLTDATQNPITIYISVDSISDETKWEAIICDIKQNLGDWGFLEVLIEHNSIGTSTYPLLPPEGEHNDIKMRALRNRLLIKDNYNATVNLGDSIGMSRETENPDGRCPQGGTLGCYLELKTKGNPVWTKYGLASYNVVQRSLGDPAVAPNGSPQSDSDLWNIDEDEAQAWALVESPPRTKHKYAIWNLNQKIQSLEERDDSDQMKVYEKEWRAEKASKLAFFNNHAHLFGHLSAGSGFRYTPEPVSYQLDWALIKPFGSRQGSNRLPERSVWEKQSDDVSDWPNSQTYNGGYLQDQSHSICYDAEETDWTMPLVRKGWKVGATTGATVGEFHDFRPSVRMSDGKNKKLSSSELYVLHSRLNRSTATPVSGDSGAVVFDHNGGILGLIVGTQRPICVEKEYSFVTPIEHVFEDIKSSSKGEITDIRVAREDP